MKNVLAIGCSNREFFNIMLTYYPKDINEKFDICIFIDNTKNILPDIKSIIKEHNIPIFNKAKLIEISDLYNFFENRHAFNEKSKSFIELYGAMFKLMIPVYLQDKFNTEKIYTIDDDQFIFNDISYVFEKYDTFVFKKENLFAIKSKYEQIMNSFNEIFNTSFSLDEVNDFSLNSGNILYNIKLDKEYEQYVVNFIKNEGVHDLFFNCPGYTSWTVEQRFQHFNMHRLKHQFGIELFPGHEVRYMSMVGEPKEKQLIKKVPDIIHYAIGAQKYLWLRHFLPAIAWRFNNFVYEPKYELMDILYNEDYKHESFKSDYIKKLNTKTEKTLF